MENDDNLEFVVDSGDDAMGAALHVEHNAQPRLRRLGIGLLHVAPFFPNSRSNCLHPTVEMPSGLPMFLAKYINLVPANNPHDRISIQTR